MINNLSNLPDGFSESETYLICPKCGGTMYAQESYAEGILLVNIECEDCGHSISNEEDL
jgi:ribosomal protein S27E